MTLVELKAVCLWALLQSDISATVRRICIGSRATNKWRGISEGCLDELDIRKRRLEVGDGGRGARRGERKAIGLRPREVSVSSHRDGGEALLLDDCDDGIEFLLRSGRKNR